MAEQAPIVAESLKRLEFSEVHLHDALDITTGKEDEAWKYGVIIDRPGRWPHGQIRAISPDGNASESLGFELHGCGLWTDRRQNPVQKQDRAFTPYYDGLIVGDFMWGRFDGDDDRSVFDKPRQQISEIVYTPYRENAILQTLANLACAASVSKIREFLPIEDPTFTPKDIRETLKKLVEASQVSFLPKKVQLFELAAAG